MIAEFPSAAARQDGGAQSGRSRDTA